MPENWLLDNKAPLRMLFALNRGLTFRLNLIVLIASAIGLLCLVTWGMGGDLIPWYALFRPFSGLAFVLAIVWAIVSIIVNAVSRKCAIGEVIQAERVASSHSSNFAVLIFLVGAGFLFLYILFAALSRSHIIGY
jgi:uncharacterized membrane protein